MFELFGPQWAFEYDNKPNMDYFSRGIYTING